MKKETLYIPSADKKHSLHTVIWQPEGDIVAAVQLVHGMVEYINRYEAFAEHLCESGIAVIGHDHLGHGLTAQAEAEYGFFHETDGRKLLIRDIYRITQEMKLHFPQVPHFILGHSMGSFCVRKYLTFFGSEVDGAILLGTGNPPVPLLMAGKALARHMAEKKGDHYRSGMLTKIAFFNYLRHIPHPQTHRDWLSRDAEKVAEYNSHDYCSFLFTASAYEDLFSIIAYAVKELRLEEVPRGLPLLLAAGDMDPVGSWGKAPRELCRSYLALGFRDVSLKLYPGGRHEIINEINRTEVYEDLKNWILSKAKVAENEK